MGTQSILETKLLYGVFFGMVGLGFTILGKIVWDWLQVRKIQSQTTEGPGSNGKGDMGVVRRVVDAIKNDTERLKENDHDQQGQLGEIAKTGVRQQVLQEEMLKESKRQTELLIEMAKRK